MSILNKKKRNKAKTTDEQLAKAKTVEATSAKKVEPQVVNADEMARNHTITGNDYQQYYRQLIGQKG